MRNEFMTLSLLLDALLVEIQTQMELKLRNDLRYDKVLFFQIMDVKLSAVVQAFRIINQYKHAHEMEMILIRLDATAAIVLDI